MLGRRVKQMNLVLGLVEFRNISLLAKGRYQLGIQVLVGGQLMKLAYYSEDDFQQQKCQLRNNNNYSTRVQYHSDDEQCQNYNNNNKRNNIKTNNNNNNNSQQQPINNSKHIYYYQSYPFYVKYHCNFILSIYLSGERIKMKSIMMYTGETGQELADIKVTLFRRRQIKHIGDCIDNDAEQEFKQLQHVWFSVNCNEHYLQYKQIMFTNPQCASFKIVILNCPQMQYSQVHYLSKCNIKSIKPKKQIIDRQQVLLQQIRKMVKKQRYQTFILKKQLCDMLKQFTTEQMIIKLPLHFVQKQSMSMDQVETSQLKFFKYLAFYQRYYTSQDMLKQQMDHINFDKITIIKQFIDSFQQDNLILTVLEEKQNITNMKKFKNFIIQTETVLPIDNMFAKYSHEEMKLKKGKIKLIDNNIVIAASVTDHVFENAFIVDKVTTKKISNNFMHQRSFIKYPLVFKDLLYIQKQHMQKSDTLLICILTKKVRKKKKYFIFAHGFQGLPIDLSFLINMIRFSNQKIKTFVLKSYKNHMGQSIESMASRAATQIDGIFKKIDMNEIQPEITFIGHSMGPIILRAAFKHLPHLNQYYSQFISICCPHLGYIQGTKFLTQAGLSILSKLKPIQSLSQLSNRDNSDLEKTFIYKLSKQGSLRHFKRIMLIASMQDDYVPWHSARIEPFLEKGNKDKIEREMIDNIFGVSFKQTKIQRIQRIQISFPHQKEKSLNSLIGRTCHIKPLTDRGFLEIFTKQLLQS